MNRNRNTQDCSDTSVRSDAVAVKRGGRSRLSTRRLAAFVPVVAVGVQMAIPANAAAYNDHDRWVPEWVCFAPGSRSGLGGYHKGYIGDYGSVSAKTHGSCGGNTTNQGWISADVTYASAIYPTPVSVGSVQIGVGVGSSVSFGYGCRHATRNAHDHWLECYATWAN
jgi:hypothetical protein